MRQAFVNVHAANVRAYEACCKAERAGKEYIGIQRLRAGGYRLAVLAVSRGETCMAMSIAADWASNIVYRLCYLGLIEASQDDADEYYEELARV